MKLSSITTPVAVLGCLLVSSECAADWANKCANAANVKCVEVTVSSTDGTITLEDPIGVLHGNKPKVIWILPEGYVFNYSSGGAALKTSSADIGNPSGVSDDGDDDTTRLSKRFKLKVKNVLSTSYPYTLTFHEMNGGKPTRKFVCDPTIINSDAVPATPPGKKRDPKSVGPRAVTTVTCTVSAS